MGAGRNYMKIGLLTAGIGKDEHPHTLRAIAEHAERLGFGTVWAPEHVVLFDRYTESKYPYSQDGAFAAPSTIDWMDPFVALTWAAARTSKIRLASGICLGPEHNPLVLAQVIASLDYLSGGSLARGVRQGRPALFAWAAGSSHWAWKSDARRRNSRRSAFRSSGARNARASTSP